MTKQHIESMKNKSKQAENKRLITQVSIYLRTETNLVSETLCTFQKTNRWTVKKPSEL
jgi:hypothetical protein